MDWETIGLNWERLAPLAQAQFAGCSEDDLKAAGGNRDALNRCIAKANGITEQEAAHQTQEWALRLEAAEGDVQPRPRTDPPRTARTERGVNYPPPVQVEQPAKE